MISFPFPLVNRSKQGGVNEFRTHLGLLVVVAILATIPQAMGVPWGIALVLLGLVTGGMGTLGGSAAERTLIYVLAVALPGFSDSLDVIPTIGPWVNQVLDGIATGVQGVAVAVVVMALYGRIMPGSK